MLGIPAKLPFLSSGNFGKTSISHEINLIQSEIRKVSRAEDVLVSREDEE